LFFFKDCASLQQLHPKRCGGNNGIVPMFVCIVADAIDKGPCVTISRALGINPWPAALGVALIGPWTPLGWPACAGGLNDPCLVVIGHASARDTALYFEVVSIHQCGLAESHE
jgi:hypothetical protein